MVSGKNAPQLKGQKIATGIYLLEDGSLSFELHEIVTASGNEDTKENREKAAQWIIEKFASEGQQVEIHRYVSSHPTTQRMAA